MRGLGGELVAIDRDQAEIVEQAGLVAQHLQPGVDALQQRQFVAGVFGGDQLRQDFVEQGDDALAQRELVGVCSGSARTTG